MYWSIGIGAVVALILQQLVSKGLRKLGGNRARFGSWKFWLIFLGISAAITMVATSLISVAMITIIGIPIGLFLMVAPFLFLVVFGTWLIRRLTGHDWMGTGAAMIATICLLAVPPFFANRILDGVAKQQVAGDLDEGTKPDGKVIAVRAPVFWGKGKGVLYCDGFCQRALMNGVAERVLVVEQDLDEPLDPSMLVESFRLQRQPSCEPVKLPNGYDPIEIAEDRKDFKNKSVTELMQLEFAKGNCLIKEQVQLGTAGIVLSYGNFKKGSNALGAGLSLFADTVKADRISLHERRDGAFVETFRKTFVVTYKLAPLYAPTAEGGSMLSMEPALARVRETINIDQKYYEKPDWTAFLVDRLGYDLALRGDNAEEATRSVLKEAMLRTGTAVPSAVADDFFRSFNMRNALTSDDLELMRQLLEDDRFPVSQWAANALRNAKALPPAQADAIAEAMFRRLRSHSQTYPPVASSDNSLDLPAIGSVLSVLPRDTILKHRADLDWLSRQELLRVPAYNALMRYADFGAEGVEPLLYLIDDAQRFRNKDDYNNGNDWQHPYLAGMIGLCKLGADGQAAILPLYDRLDSGVIANWGSYNRLTIHTLVRMGADPDDIWQHVGAGKSAKAEDTVKARREFDREAARASKREECWY